jgi:hypothetical protein
MEKTQGTKTLEAQNRTTAEGIRQAVLWTVQDVIDTVVYVQYGQGE